jgi:hypothetical protein
MIGSALIAVEAIKIKSLALMAAAIRAAKMSDKTGRVLLVIIHQGYHSSNLYFQASMLNEFLKKQNAFHAKQ